MNSRSILLTGISLCCLAVVIGAFGAHALKERLELTGRADTFELAVRYQFYHAFALVIAGILADRFYSKPIHRAAVAFVLGVIFFSGSLYTLALTGINKFGAITPLGGLFFIAGWILLLIGVYKIKKPE